jgi:phosphoribosylanthranilate isomerase
MWVKICGVRDVETALALAALRVDAVGLNFFAGSPRCVAAGVAAEIVRRLEGQVEAVGLFVNHDLDDVVPIVRECGLRTLQFHGDESPAFLAAVAMALPEARLIRAFRIGDEGCGEIEEYLASCAGHDVSLRACLVDARTTDGAYGGTGRIPPWDVIAAEYRRDEWPPLVLAGGLTEANVSQAIAAVGPWGVDVSSGVESSPGVKDRARMAEFVRAARQGRSTTG